jgi:hypothetical protein
MLNPPIIKDWKVFYYIHSKLRSTLLFFPKKRYERNGIKFSNLVERKKPIGLIQALNKFKQLGNVLKVNVISGDRLIRIVGIV